MANIAYTFVKDANGVNPYFYSEIGKSVLMRRSDTMKLAKIFDTDRNSTVEESRLQEFVDQILKDAPVAPDGSRFSLWTNIKCPTCGYEFPYDGGVRSITRRLTDATILLDKMCVVGDTNEDSYTIQIT